MTTTALTPIQVQRLREQRLASMRASEADIVEATNACLLEAQPASDGTIYVSLESISGHTSKLVGCLNIFNILQTHYGKSWDVKDAQGTLEFGWRFKPRL